LFGALKLRAAAWRRVKHCAKAKRGDSFLLLLRGRARHLDFARKFWEKLRPLDALRLAKPPPRSYLRGMTRNPMRRIGTHIAATNATNVWLFKPSDCRVVRMAEQGSPSQRLSGRQPD
jgi:hypothetical protein